VCGG